jgi:hypothetical protein
MLVQLCRQLVDPGLEMPTPILNASGQTVDARGKAVDPEVDTTEKPIDPGFDLAPVWDSLRPCANAIIPQKRDGHPDHAKQFLYGERLLNVHVTFLQNAVGGQRFRRRGRTS